MKIIVYKGFHESDFYEITLKHFKLTDNYDFETDENWEKLVDDIDYEFPFEIVECNDDEFVAFKEFLYETYDIFNSDEVAMDRIIVKRRDEIIDYRDAADLCQNEIKELQEQLESLQYEMKIYDNIYYDKYHCHIMDEK